jgi:hypothetical protein
LASASLSAKLYSVPGFNTGKGGTGIIEGGGVSISVHWIGTGGGGLSISVRWIGTGGGGVSISVCWIGTGGCTAIETEWCWEQPATTESISNALDCTGRISKLQTSCIACHLSPLGVAIP